MKYDVVIIGGGPGGSAVATICARRGLSTALIERTRFSRHRAGESLHPGVESLFEELGIGGDVRAARFPRHLGHWIEIAARLTFQPIGGDERGPWCGFQVLRSRLDNILLAGAVRAGTTVISGTSVRTLTLADNGRVVGIETTSGGIEAKFTIDAGGDSHFVSRRLRIPLVRYSPRLVARYGYARGHCPSRDHAPIFRKSDDGWTWVARIGRGVYGWTSVSVGAATVPVVPELSVLRSCSKPLGADVTWRILERAAGPGWFAVGDAAAICDPAAAQGVLRAISSGIMAGHSLLTAWRGECSEEDAAAQYDGWLQAWFRQTARSFRSSHDSLYSMCLLSKLAPR